jgi:predicted PurR-regulated permease PerM
LPGLEWAELLVIELSILVGLLLLYIASQIVQQFSHFLLLIAAAGAIALLVAPVVAWLERRVRSRVAATAIVYLGVLLVAGSALVLITVPLIHEATVFAQELPRHIEELPQQAAGLERVAAGFGITLQLTELAGRVTSQIETGGTAVLVGTVGVAAGITSALADVGLALVLSFYLSVDGPRLRDKVVGRIPPAHLSKALRVEASIRRVFGGYLRAQMILAVVLGVVGGVGSALLGLPYPVVIGVLAGVLELVPMFGSLLGAVPALLIALFQPFPTVLWVLLFFFAVNQAESYLLAPRISGESLGLTPFYTLVALLVGIELAGFLGALVAVPVAALLVDLTRPEPERSVPEPIAVEGT